jgi:hypothetical protein
MCRFRSLKLKQDATSFTIKSVHGRLVQTVNAKDVEYIECKVIDNNRHIMYLEKEMLKLKRKKRKDKKNSNTKQKNTARTRQEIFSHAFHHL